MANYPFEAWYESGTVVAFESPCSWSHVFSVFKNFAQCEGSGELYCRGVLVRRTGRNKYCDYSIYSWYRPVPESAYGQLDANAMYVCDELAAMEEELALESQRNQFEADCCMCGSEPSLCKLKSYSDFWGSFDWEDLNL